METWTRKLYLFSTPKARVFSWRMWVALNRTGSYSKCSKWRPLAFPQSRMHAATHILQENTHACGVLKRHNFRVHVSLGSAETLVRRCGIINHHSIAYSLSNISAKNYRNQLMWVESLVCNISVVFWDTVYILLLQMSIYLCVLSTNFHIFCKVIVVIKRVIKSGIFIEPQCVSKLWHSCTHLYKSVIL